MATLKKTKMVFKTDYHLMLVKSIAECSREHSATQGNILQYFQPSLSYPLSLIRPLFCLFLSGRFTQGLLYVYLNISQTQSTSSIESQMRENV